MSASNLNAALYSAALLAAVIGTYFIFTANLQIHARHKLKIQLCVISTLLAAVSCFFSLFFDPVLNQLPNRLLKFIANFTSISSDFLIFDISIFIFAAAHYTRVYNYCNFATIAFVLGLIFALKIEYQYLNEIFSYHSNSVIAIFDFLVIVFDFSIFWTLIRVHQSMMKELQNKVNVMHEKLLAKMGVSSARPTTSGQQVRALEIFVVTFSYNLALIFAIFWAPFLIISVADFVVAFKDLRLSQVILVARWCNVIVGSSKGIFIYYAYKRSQVKYEETLKVLIKETIPEKLLERLLIDTDKDNGWEESDPLLVESANPHHLPLDDLFDILCNDNQTTLGLPNSFRRPVYKPFKDIDGATILMLQHAGHLDVME